LKTINFKLKIFVNCFSLPQKSKNKTRKRIDDGNNQGNPRKWRIKNMDRDQAQVSNRIPISKIKLKSLKHSQKYQRNLIEKQQ
jgi:hypothetical protein